MNNKMIKDERVTSVKRKIQSDGFGIVYILLLISVLVQQFVFKAPISQYVVEMVLFFAMSVYIIIFNIVKGNDLYPSNNKKSNTLIIIQSVFTGLTIALINTVQNYFQYGEVVQDTLVKHTVLVAIISFISTTVAVFVLLKVLSYLNNKKQQKINSELDDDE